MHIKIITFDIFHTLALQSWLCNSRIEKKVLAPEWQLRLYAPYGIEMATERKGPTRG